MWRRPYKIKTLFPFSDPTEDFFHFLQVTHIATKPFDLRLLARFLFDLLDGIFALVFLAVDHNYPSAIEHKCTSDFVAVMEQKFDISGSQSEEYMGIPRNRRFNLPYAQCAASDKRDSAIKIVDLLLRPDDAVEC